MVNKDVYKASPDNQMQLSLNVIISVKLLRYDPVRGV